MHILKLRSMDFRLIPHMISKTILKVFLSHLKRIFKLEDGCYFLILGHICIEQPVFLGQAEKHLCTCTVYHTTVTIIIVCNKTTIHVKNITVQLMLYCRY